MISEFFPLPMPHYLALLKNQLFQRVICTQIQNETPHVSNFFLIKKTHGWIACLNTI
uniref:Uncharacterized protein n=1 Tax=Rhizophora mucronata TaxID=61149 RepID=A0A2P2R2A9_RHIMU